MIARRCVPSPTFLSSSCASTLKRSLRPSMSRSSAFTRTFWPLGVAPKCLTWTSKPTVVCPSGRWLCTAWMPARSIRPIIDGVDSTPSPPMCLTTSLSSTTVVISAVRPGVNRSLDMVDSPLWHGDLSRVPRPGQCGRSSAERGHAHGAAVAPAAFEEIAVLPVPGGVLHAGEQQPVAVEAAVLHVVLEQALRDLLVVRVVAEPAGGQRQ